MRDDTRQITEPGISPAVDVERDRWRVQRFADGRIRVTIQHGATVVAHTGAPTAVRARIAVDAPALATRIGNDVSDVVDGRINTPGGSPR